MGRNYETKQNRGLSQMNDDNCLILHGMINSIPCICHLININRRKKKPTTRNHWAPREWHFHYCPIGYNSFSHFNLQAPGFGPQRLGFSRSDVVLPNQVHLPEVQQARCCKPRGWQQRKVYSQGGQVRRWENEAQICFPKGEGLEMFMGQRSRVVLGVRRGIGGGGKVR